MLATDREMLAYDLRCDAEYARQRIAAHSDLDSPSLPAVLAAARRFVVWCEVTSDQLVTEPGADVECLRGAWRREAVASDIRFIPYAEFAALACLGCSALAVVFVMVGYVSGGGGSWGYAVAFAVIAAVAFGYGRLAPSRLAVGPDADHSSIAALSAQELLTFGDRPRRRRCQPEFTRRQVRLAGIWFHRKV